MSKIDWGSVAMGAGTTLFFVVPTVLVARALSGDKPEPIDAIVPLALLFGFGAGGFSAARRAGSLPFLHSATSAMAAWVVIVIAVVGRSGFNLARALTLVLFVIVTMACAMGGGLLAFRRTRQDTRAEES